MKLKIIPKDLSDIRDIGLTRDFFDTLDSTYSKIIEEFIRNSRNKISKKLYDFHIVIDSILIRPAIENIDVISESLSNIEMQEEFDKEVRYNY